MEILICASISWCVIVVDFEILTSNEENAFIALSSEPASFAFPRICLFTVS